jgi:hypothetical protein
MSLATFDFTERARPVVEIGLGDSRAPIGVAQWDSAKWDDPAATWVAGEPVWIDISCYVRSARCQYGRAAVTDRFVAGLATLMVDNSTGWADTSTVNPPTPIQMRPGREIRFGVNHDAYGTVWLYRGFIDAVTPSYDPVDVDTVQLDCIDALGEVNRGKTVPQPAPIDDGMAPVARVNKILDLAGWPAYRRDLASAVTPLAAIDYGGQIADMLGISADSVGGAIFGDTRGYIVFHGSGWPSYQPGQPVDATIGNIDPTDICPTGWQRPFDRADMATRVIIGRDSSSAQTFDDLTGQQYYGIEPFERTNLLTKSDATIGLLGQRILALRGASTAPRVRQVSFDASTDPTALDLMASVDVTKPSVYRCRLNYGRGLVFDANHFATAVAHEMDRSRWTLDLSLDLASPFVTAPSGWDEARWNQRTWS